MKNYTVTVLRIVEMRAKVEVEASCEEDARSGALAAVDEKGTHWEEVSTVSEKTLRVREEPYDYVCSQCGDEGYGFHACQGPT